MSEPRASRPRVPQGYDVPTDESNLLPWSHARTRLEQAQNYWVCTATTKGKPHAAPLWGAWVNDRLFFEGSPATRWARNLSANPQASVHLESGSDVVIALRAGALPPVEGAILDEDDVGETVAERIAKSFAARYNGYRTQSRGFFILVPRVAFAWSRFPHDATRWTFDKPSSGV